MRTTEEMIATMMDSEKAPAFIAAMQMLFALADDAGVIVDIEVRVPSKRAKKSTSGELQ